MTDHDDRKRARPLVGESIGTRPTQRVEVPVGLEKLLYLAARDPSIRTKLLTDRGTTIDELGVRLRSSERAMLEALSPAILDAMIERIEPANLRKRRFMDVVALAATSLVASSVLTDCDGDTQTKGIRPELGGSAGATVHVSGGRATAGILAWGGTQSGDAGGADAGDDRDAMANPDSVAFTPGDAAADAACDPGAEAACVPETDCDGDADCGADS